MELTNGLGVLVRISVLPPHVDLISREMHERHVLDRFANSDDEHHSAVLGSLLSKLESKPRLRAVSGTHIDRSPDAALNTCAFKYDSRLVAKGLFNFRGLRLGA